MFRSVKLQLLLLVGFTAATFVFFGGTTEEERSTGTSHRSFLNACEESDFVRASTTNTVQAAGLCSCILSWHVNTKPGGTSKPRPPIELYQSPATPAGQRSASHDLDRQARAACAKPG